MRAPGRQVPVGEQSMEWLEGWLEGTQRTLGTDGARPLAGGRGARAKARRTESPGRDRICADLLHLVKAYHWRHVFIVWIPGSTAHIGLPYV